MTTPDPDPRTTPGLEPGGGTPPGETPPAESSTAAAPSDQPRVPGRGANRAAAITVVVVGVLAAAFFVAYLAGVLD